MMNYRIQSRFCAQCVWCACLFTAPTAFATDWLNPNGGNWHRAENWSAGIPDSSDFAFIPPSIGHASGEIYLTANAHARAILDEFGNSFDLRGFVLDANHINYFDNTSFFNSTSTRSDFKLRGDFGGGVVFIGRGVDAKFSSTLVGVDNGPPGSPPPKMEVTVADGGTATIMGDLDLAHNPESTVRVAGPGSTLTVTGRILDPQIPGPFPTYRILVEDQGFLKVDLANTAGTLTGSTSIELRNGIAQLPPPINQGGRQVRGYGLLIGFDSSVDTKLEINNPSGRVFLDRDLEIDSEHATVFSLGIAELAGSVAVINTSILHADSGLRVNAGGMLFADENSVIESNVELAGGTLDMAGDTKKIMDGIVSGYGIVRGPALSISHPVVNNPTGTVSLDHDLFVSSTTTTVHTRGAASLGPTTSVTGGTLRARGLNGQTATLLVGDNSLLSGHGTVDAAFIGSAASRIQVIGSDLTIGTLSSDVSNGFQTDGRITIDSGRLVIVSATPAKLGSLTELRGRALHAAGGIALGTGDQLVGPGMVEARVAAAIGSVIRSTGSLSLGDAGSLAGFASDGELHVASSTVTLLDANEAVLGSLTTLGAGNNPGQLVAENGAVVGFGRSVSGYGTIDTPNDLSKPLLNNGHIEGNSMADPITLTGYVKGVGTMSNVVIMGTDAPGFSPSTVHRGNVEYAGALEVELAGAAVGGYDQVVHSGVAELGGTLDVRLLDGFAAAIGDRFEILRAAGGLTGTFDNVLLPTVANLTLSVLYETNSVSLIATLPGDYNFDGRVDAADYVVWRKGLGVTQTPADYDAWRTHFGQSATGATMASSVPEPCSWPLFCIAIAWISLNRSPVKSKDVRYRDWHSACV